MNKLSSILVSIGCGLLMHLAGFPAPIPFLAWIAPAGVLILCLRQSPPKAFLYGFIYGIAANAIGLWNILEPLGLPGLAIVVFILISGITSSIIFGLSRALYRKDLNLYMFPWIFASVQACVYLLAEHPMAGGHMVPLTASQYKIGLAHTIAAAGGQYLLIFMLGLLSASIAVMIVQRSKAVYVSLLAAGVFTGIILCTGFFSSTQEGDGVTVAALVHKRDSGLNRKWGSNKPDSVTLTDALQELAQYERLTHQAASKGAGVIVWNEYGLRVRSTWKDSIQQRVKALAKNENAFIVAGYIDMDAKTNNAFSVTPGGETSVYIKKKLVPVDESAWMQSGKADFSMPVTGNALVKPAVRICYDNDFPGGNRQSRLNGANLFLIPAADWKAVSELHLGAQSFRSSENGIPLVRAVSNGYSAFVNEEGEIVAKESSFTNDVILTGTVQLNQKSTLYTSAGNWILFICGAVLLYTAFVKFRRPNPARQFQTKEALA